MDGNMTVSAAVDRQRHPSYCGNKL